MAQSVVDRYPVPEFSRPQSVSLASFAGGLNNKHSPLLLKNDELADIQNFNYDQRGTLVKRTGYSARYTAPFAAGAVRGLYNYRKEDGSSYLLMAAEDKLFYERIDPVKTFDSEAEWNEGTYTRLRGTNGSLGFIPPLFDRNSTALKVSDDATSYAVDAPRFETGRYGSALTLEEETTNLLVNAGFETGTTDGWTVTVGGACTATADGTAKRSGSYGLRIYDPSANYSAQITQDVAGTAGQAYTLTAYGNKQGVGVNIYLKFLDATRAELASSTVAISAASWTRYALTATAPANTAFVRVQFSTTSTDDSATPTWVDDVQLEAKGFKTSLVPVAADSTTRAVRAAETLTFLGDALENSAGTIQAYVKLMNAPQTNLLTNPDFKSVLGAEWSITAGTGCSAVRDTTSKRSGSYGLHITDAGAGVNVLVSQVVVARPSTAYSASVWVKKASGTGNLTVTLSQNAGAWSDLASTTVSAATWTRVALNGTTSASATQVRLSFATANDDTVEYYVDDCLLSVTHQRHIFDGNGATNQNLRLYVDTEGYLVMAYGTGSAEVIVTGTTAMAVNTWYAVAAKWSSAGATIYVNGASEGTSATAPSVVFGTLVYVGSRADGTGQLMGYLDDLRFSAIARTDTQISNDYSGGAALTSDANTLLLFDFDGDIDSTGHAVVDGTWVSPAIDLVTVADKATGAITRTPVACAGSTFYIETRASADGASWGPWTGLGAENSIISASERYLQVRVTLKTSVYPLATTLSYLAVVYDVAPLVVTLGENYSTTARWSFVTQNDNLYAHNGDNYPLKWDGTTLTTAPGSPPVCPYALVHKNFMFLAGSQSNRSRLYFSNLGDPETWSALDYIDVGRGDGDAITGLGTILDMLVIMKQGSVWLLQGDSSANFVLKRVEAAAGCVSRGSIAIVNQNVAMLGRDGVRFFDGLRSLLASEKIQMTVDDLNQRQITKAAGVYYDHKYLLAVPEDENSTANDLVLVFDTLLSAWTLYRGLPVAEWCVWRRANREYLAFGSSEKGQVYLIDGSLTDDGAAIVAYAVTKALSFGSAEAVKLARNLYVSAAEGDTGTADLEVSFFKDMSATPTDHIHVSIGAGLTVGRVIPSVVGVSMVRTLQIKVYHSEATHGVRIYGLTQEYVTKGVRAS